jgi:hypothetical protein
MSRKWTLLRRGAKLSFRPLVNGGRQSETRRDERRVEVA